MTEVLALSAALTLISFSLGGPARATSPSASTSANPASPSVAQIAAGSARPAVATATPPPAGAPDNGRKQATFGIGAASAKGVDRRPYLRYFTSPGAEAVDHIAVENFNVQPVTLALYTADALNAPDGSLGYLPRATKSSSAATWLTIRTPGGLPGITLKPRSMTILPLLLKVPVTATPGDHAAGVFVSLTGKIKGTSGQNLNFEQRIALRTFIRVSGPLQPALTVESLRASFDGSTKPFGRGAVTLTYSVRNTGNVELGAAQTAGIDGLIGKTGSTVRPPNIALLLPGGSQQVTVRVPNVLASFAMKATVTLVPQALSGDADPKMADIQASTTFFAVPWIPLAVVVLLILLGALWLLHSRRQRSRRQNPPAPSAPSQPVLAERT